MPILVFFQKLAQFLEALTSGLEVFAIGSISVVCRLVHVSLKAAPHFIGTYQALSFGRGPPQKGNDIPLLGRFGVGGQLKGLGLAVVSQDGNLGAFDPHHYSKERMWLLDGLYQHSDSNPLFTDPSGQYGHTCSVFKGAGPMVAGGLKFVSFGQDYG